jgi:hypothetical protein
MRDKDEILVDMDDDDDDGSQAINCAAGPEPTVENDRANTVQWKRNKSRSFMPVPRAGPGPTTRGTCQNWERIKGRASTKCCCGVATCRGTLEVSPTHLKNWNLENPMMDIGWLVLERRDEKSLIATTQSYSRTGIPTVLSCQIHV